MNPITSHSASSFPHKQCVTLWPDRLHLTGTVFFSQEYETTIPLLNLTGGIVSRYATRNQLFHAGLFLMILCGFVSFVFLGIVPTNTQMWAFRSVACALFVLGLALSLGFARKLEVVSFTNQQGIRMLSIFGTAKQKRSLEQFAKDVTDAIGNLPKVSER